MINGEGPAKSYSTSFGLSVSPNATFLSQPSSYSGAQPSRASTGAFAKQLKPFATEDIKILLLENVNQIGREHLLKQGYQVDFLKSSLPEDELIERIRWGASPLLEKSVQLLQILTETEMFM